MIILVPLEAKLWRSEKLKFWEEKNFFSQNFYFLRYESDQGIKSNLNLSKFLNFLVKNCSFAFCKRWRSKNIIGLKNIFQKIAIFMIFFNFDTKILACSSGHRDFFFLYLDSPKPGEHFVNPHDHFSSSRSKTMKVWKIKILRRKILFFSKV